MVIYGRRMSDIARSLDMPLSTTSAYINCRRHATPEQIARLEAAIVGVRRLVPHIGSEDRALVA